MTSTVSAPERSPILRAGEFEQISKLAYEHFGVDLRNGKQALVEARIGKKLRELGLASFQEYFDYVKADTSGNALTSMVDVLTTNHTSFFREPRHFDFMIDTILPSLMHRPQLNIWSAACSSGEEPYSIALALLESTLSEAFTRVRIRASDISTRVLEKAVRGVYPTERCEGIPNHLRHLYMLKGRNTCADSFRFKPQVRGMIDFMHLNLMHELPRNYTCSIIFCRNIMIYFDRPTQQDLVKRLTEHLEPGGYLFIGHSESLNSITHTLDYVAPATYRKPASGRSSGRPS